MATEAQRDHFDYTSGSGNLNGGPWQFVSCLNVGSAEGSFDGQAMPAGAVLTLPYLPGKVYETLAYDATTSGVRLLISAIY